VIARASVGRFKGPSAVGDDLRRFASLTWTLATTDFKLRFFGSALGYVWTLMRPLLLFGVLYFVFTEIVRFGDDVRYYPVYLLSSIVLFTFFSETTTRGLTSLVDRENLIRKVRFPQLVIPLSVALHALFNLGLNLIVVFVFLFASGITPTVDWLQIPVLLLLMIVLGTGVTMLLSALFVHYRDVQPIWEVVLQMLFYASPVIYAVTAVPGNLDDFVMYNPIAVVLTQFRHAVIDQDAPSAAAAIGGAELLLIPLAMVAALFVAGAWVFTRAAPRIAEDL
jgi:ABC-2 type transport system permease protein